MKKVSLQTFLDRHTWQIQQCLSLENWDITVVYHKKGWNVAKGVMMEVKIDYKYQRVEMCYGDDCKKQWKKGWKNNIVESLCHEMCHIYTNWSLDHVKNRTELFNYQFEFYTSMIDRIVKEKYFDYRKKWNVSLGTGLIKKK